MPEPSAVRRRFPRVEVLGNVTGEVSLLHDVTLLDLSEGGARLEHAGQFALNTTCFVRLPAPGGKLVLKGRVVHSAASRIVPGSGGGTSLLYQSGIEFIELTAETLQALPQVLAGLSDTPSPA